MPLGKERPAVAVTLEMRIRDTHRGCGEHKEPPLGGVIAKIDEKSEGEKKQGSKIVKKKEGCCILKLYLKKK